MDAARDFERSRIDELRQSRRLAWGIAMLCMAITTLAILAFLLAYLVRTEPEPFIIQVDNSTGASTVLRSLKDDKDRYGEVVDKYWLHAYVRAREGYDWWTISEGAEAVRLMSDAPVGDEYMRRLREDSSPLSVLKDKGRVAARVTAIAFVGEIAQVRFTTQKQSVSGDNHDGAPEQKWIATIAYRFDSGWATEAQRNINPLGFKVLSYRVDPEVIK